MVTVFSQEFCPKCDELKDLLKKNNIEFEEKDVNKDHTAYAKMLFNDIEETPAVEYGDSVLAGEVEDIFKEIIKND